MNPELTKQERKVLSNFMGTSMYSRLEQWEGKFYWGGESYCTKPVTVGPVYDSLLKKGFITYHHGHIPRYGGVYTKTSMAKDYVCQNKENGRACSEGKIFIPSESDPDEGEKILCMACDGTGLVLSIARKEGDL